MEKRLNFRTKDPQPFRDMGGDHVAVYAGKCARCKRNVYGLGREFNAATCPRRPCLAGCDHINVHPDHATDPDPRGYIGPPHSLQTWEAQEYDMQGPDVRFCWDCVNEHGSEGNQKCLAIARARWTVAAAS